MPAGLRHRAPVPNGMQGSVVVLSTRLSWRRQPWSSGRSPLWATACSSVSGFACVPRRRVAQ
eukprot:2870686-Alexandrium_andersonii.AAC.1